MLRGGGLSFREDITATRKWRDSEVGDSYGTPSQRAVVENTHRMYLACSGIVFAWVVLGTLFYAWFNTWPLPQSFFYAVDAGMSIGFCTDVKETQVASRAFTVIYILLGASCVGGALALMVENVLEGAKSRSSEWYRLTLERDSFKNAFVASGMSLSLSYEAFRGVLEYQNGCHLTDEEFAYVCEKFDPSRLGWIQYEDFVKRFHGTHKMLPASKYVRSKFWPLRAAAIAWNGVSPLLSDGNRIYLVFLLWVGMGVVWGIISQGWDPITSTHFAISALATGGLTAPPVDANGILPAGPAIFCGVFCLFGIPLFALTLSQFARVLIEKHIIEAEQNAITRPLSRAEYDFAKKLCSDDGAVRMSDFIVLQLFREGKLSVESLEFMKRQFRVFDKNHSGRLNFNEATLNEFADPKKWIMFRFKR